MIWYTVKSGDTVWSLAQRCNVDPVVIVRLNGLADPNVLQIGQRLRLPCNPRPPMPPAPPAPPERPPRPPRPPMPAPCEDTYVVQAGDTLFSIAAANGTTVEELVRLNRLRRPNLIFPGDRLCLPR